jgi:dTMP kinase
MARGRFITIEGGEGVGKTTQIAAIQCHLERKGIQVVQTREPGGTLLAERIRQLLLDSSSETFPDVCELLMMFAARSTHIANVIEPALRRGDWVVCDRFTDATYAYQGGGRGISPVTIQYLEGLVQGDSRPELTLLLDAPTEVGLQRARRRNPAAISDRFESERAAFFERVRGAYLDIARREPDRVRVIDSTREPADVTADIVTELDAFIARIRK